MERSNTDTCTGITTFKDLEQQLIEEITRSVLELPTKPKETEKKEPNTVPYPVRRSVGPNGRLCRLKKYKCTVFNTL